MVKRENKIGEVKIVIVSENRKCCHCNTSIHVGENAIRHQRDDMWAEFDPSAFLYSHFPDCPKKTNKEVKI